MEKKGQGGYPTHIISAIYLKINETVPRII